MTGELSAGLGTENVSARLVSEDIESLSFVGHDDHVAFLQSAENLAELLVA